MADIRINSLPTTASASSSDDFLALDGATNGTRKLSAYSPTFGGAVTINGNGTYGAIQLPSGTTSIYGVAFGTDTNLWRTDSGNLELGGSSVALIGLNVGGTNKGYFYNNGTDTTLAGAGTLTFKSNGTTTGLTLDSSNATVAGNLTVSGTGTSSFGGKIQSSAATATGYNQLYDTTGITTGRGAFAITSTGAGLAFGIEASVGGTSFANSTAYASYFGTTTATPVHFVANASIGATLTSGGNLLIGTATDNGAKFQVEGYATFNRNGADGYLSVSRTSGATGTFGAGSSNAYLGTASNHPLVLYTNNSTALTLDSSQNAQFVGRVRIGSSTIGASANPWFSAVASNGDFGIGFQGSANGAIRTGIKYTTATNLGGLDFMVGGDNNNDASVTALSLSAAGDATFAGTVTAGTWSSGTADKLKVSTAVNDYAAYFANIASSGGSYGIRLHTNTTAATDYLLVATSGAGGGSTRFIIKSNGTLNAPSLPTSSAGLSAGDIWNDGGTLKIV